MYIAELETKRNLYLDTTAKLVPEKFSSETKSSGISESFRGMKSLFGRNINILRGIKASVLSKSTFSDGVLSLYSILGLLPDSFSISVCVLAPQFVNGLLIVNPLFENLL